MTGIFLFPEGGGLVPMAEAPYDAEDVLQQLLADYPGMAGLRSVLRDLLGVPDTQAVQMLFRMGYARPVLPTPRRRPGDFFFP